VPLVGSTVLSSSLLSSARASLSFPSRATQELPELSQPDLSALADRIVRGTPGFLLVRAGSNDTADAVREVAVRRARTSHATTINAVSRPGAPLWHDVAMQLSPVDFGGGSQEPSATVEHLIASACGRRVVIVAPLPEARSWDRSVALELAARPHPFLIVFVTSAAADAKAFDADAALRGEHFEVTAQLSGRERDVWWSVLAEAASHDMAEIELSSLEAWWTQARHTASEGSATARGLSLPRALTDAEGALLLALKLAGRPWRRTDVARLGASSLAAASLVDDGIVRDSMGWLTVDPRFEDHASLGHAAPDAIKAVASALVSLAVHPIDPWALAHAADLALRAGEYRAADEAMEQALAHVEDSIARSEMISRWTAGVAACPAADRLTLQCRGADRALAVGEAEEAHQWARAAAALAPDDVAVTMLLGRSLVALGDLVAAEVTLRHVKRSDGVACDASVTALVNAELAEIAYMKGDMAAAAAAAAEALAQVPGPTARSEATSKARNTLGKILLAEAKWDDADRHFAEDAHAAASCGDTTAEFRARLNRGIAFLSKGALDGARALFEEVRSEAETVGNVRASVFALDNLAVVATWRHEYAAALAFYERTLKLRRRMGDRLNTARIVANLAELRRKLGLLEHADQAISFGRRALRSGMPAEQSAHFSFLAARVALDRGHAQSAQREVGRAIRDGELAGNRKILAEAHRVSTRIALEDGDLAHANASLIASRELMATDDARAEVALLAALLARASGDDAERLGLDALALARVVGEEEGLIEAHILLCETYRSRGEVDAARAHLQQAVTVRDQVTVGLPAEVAEAFRSRRDVQHLDRLAVQLESASLEPSSVPPPSSGSHLVPSRPSRAATLAPSFELIGVDPSMRGLYATIKKVARSSSTILIRGESGTGKELVAAALHRGSDRASGPMVTVNCAALVETLLLSELFGHEKGAFTGATARRRGRFELAEGGTLFLDEIGDISAKTQVALLRVLQERTFERVGGTGPIHVDVHIICATHRDLKAMVERGEFREDLYYRLRGIALDVPALRARLGDLPALADHLLARIAVERGEPKKTLSASALELLAMHQWPGNVRELENALRAASLFAETATITVANLVENVDDLRKAADRAELARSRSRLPEPAPVPAAPISAPRSSTLLASVEECATDTDEAVSDDGELPLPATEATATAVAYAQVRQGTLSLSDLKRQIERDCIARALAETKGNITRAAALLGMKRPRLSQLVKHYGLSAVSSEAT